MAKIKKAVFPVAGLGTRFLPATKASPKEMLPIVDKPLIQYAVEEAIEAGIDELVFVTGRSKNAITDHFDKAYELESELEKRNKHDLLSIVRSVVPEHVTCVYIRQAEALGLGHAVLCAEKLVGNEPFSVLLADDLMKGNPGILSQMVKLYEETEASILATQMVEMSDVSKYGVIGGKKRTETTWRLETIVEKPAVDKAPSNQAVVGRYILSPEIFRLLKETKPGAGGEIQLTDAIAALLAKEEVLAYAYEGKRYDCGSKIGYLQAMVEYGLEHHEVGSDFSKYLSTLRL